MPFYSRNASSIPGAMQGRRVFHQAILLFKYLEKKTVPVPVHVQSILQTHCVYRRIEWANSLVHGSPLIEKWMVVGNQMMPAFRGLQGC